jgi:excisionase family DNA binding protein
MVASPRFLTLPDVAEILNTSMAQVTALVRRGELRALKLGGRGQWRVETTELEAFIERMYAETQAHLRDQSRTPAELIPEQTPEHRDTPTSLA